MFLDLDSHKVSGGVALRVGDGEPQQYFEYFDSAHLDSDEFSRQKVRQLAHPPALLKEAGDCGSRQMVETCLDLVLEMMKHAGLSPRTQTAMMQLGVVACNQIKVSFSFITSSHHCTTLRNFPIF